MCYCQVFLSAILVLLSLECVFSKAAVGENKRTFSADLEIIRPWENCEFYKEINNTHAFCGDDLSSSSAVVINIKALKYVMDIQVGTAKEIFKVLVDTGSSYTWVFDTGCDDTDDNCKDHKKFDSSESEVIDDKFEVSYGYGKVTGKNVKDTIYLTKDIEVEKQLFGAVTKVTEKKTGYDGILGLGMKKIAEEVFRNAFETNVIDAAIFGLYIPSKGNGQITFGGVNEEHIVEDTDTTTGIISANKYKIHISNLMLGETQACSMIDQAKCKALIDTGCSNILGPADDVNAFLKDKLNTGEEKGYKVVCDDRDKFPQITITIGETDIVLEPSDYIREISKDNCKSGIKPYEKSYWVLGSIFLNKVYTKIDLTDGGKITFYKAK